MSKINVQDSYLMLMYVTIVIYHVHITISVV